MKLGHSDWFGSSSITFDPEMPFWQTCTYSCNCACQRCLDGGCCIQLRDPIGNFYSSPTTPVPSVIAHQHDYAKFDDYKLFCRTCGETKHV